MIDLLSTAALVPILFVVGIIVVFVAFGNSLQKLWVKVPPQQAAVFFGRKGKDKEGNETGFQIITGGAKLRIPLLEEVEFLDLTLISLDINVANVANKDGVLVNLRGNANVFFKNDDVSLQNATRKFLRMPRPQVESIIHKSLEGHLRGIAGQMTIEQIIGDRIIFGQNVKSEAGADLTKFGLEIDFVTISEITDNDNYISSLGQKRTAEVKRDAIIGRAEAERDATMKSSTAQQEAATLKAQNEALVAEAEKIREVKKADYLAQTQAIQATSSQAGPLAEAEKKKDVISAQQEIIRVQTLKETEIAVAQADKKEKQLMADVIKPAEAAQKKAVIDAEAAQKKTVIDAEAAREATIKTAEGSAKRIELEANADAAKIIAIGKAEAQVIQMKLEAEAAGITKKAEAYKLMDEVGRTIQMIEKIGEVGPNLVNSFAGVVSAAAAPLGNVDKITITDFGGSGNAISGLTKVAPQVIAQLVEGFKGIGINPTELLQKFKLNPEEVLENSEVQNVIAKAGLTPDMLAQLAASFSGSQVVETNAKPNPSFVSEPDGVRATILNSSSVKSQVLDEVPKNLKK